MPAPTGGDADAPAVTLRLIAALAALGRRLRRAGYECGVAEHLSAADFLLASVTGHRTPPLEELRAALGGIFCTSAHEQARFGDVFDPWCEPLLAPARERKAQPPPGREPPRWLGVSGLGRRWPVAVVVALVVGAAATYRLWPDPPVVLDPPPELAVPLPPPEITSPDLPEAVRIPGPRSPPEPVSPSARFYPGWVDWLRLAWIVPVLAWLVWLVQRIYLRHAVLSRRPPGPGEGARLEHLDVAGARHGPFAGAALAETWRRLRRFQPHPSAHLDEAATIDRTLAAGGFLDAVYRRRQIPPGYLLVIDRRHAADHAARFAGELAGAMRRENLQVAVYAYDADPRYCAAIGDPGTQRSLAAIAAEHAEAHLLLAGDVQALLEPSARRSGPSPDLASGPDSRRSSGVVAMTAPPRLARWVEVLAEAGRLAVLSSGPAWHAREWLGDGAVPGLRVVPLSPRGLMDLAGSTGSGEGDDPADLPLPRIFTVDAGRWHDRSPGRRVIRATLEALRRYLGRDGYLLLAAAAAYPGLDWRLTHALDWQLELADADRTVRLRKLARLPWLRHGRVPDGLRRALLRSLDRADVERVSGAYHGLIDHKDDRPLHLPVAVPEWKGMRAALQDLRRLSPRDLPEGDPVFARVLRGRRPRLLELALPAGLDWLKASPRWRGLALPALAGLAVIPGALWLNVWAWTGWGEAAALRGATSEMRAVHGTVPVRLAAVDGLEPHAAALAAALRDWGFRLDDAPPEGTGEAPAKTVPLPLAGVSENPNRVTYPSALRTHAERVAARVAYLYYGAEPALELDDAADVVRVDLRAAPRVFRDRFGPPVPAPEMVRVPAGAFEMGAPPGEAGRFEDEGPVHTVTVPAFAIGRYEVTFDEYDAFTDATGRARVEDSGWGRGRRPVVNVSWADARAYAAWLSAETGRRYRLPTEAEWEYAARAGTATRFWWGDEVGVGNANCYDCGSEWDNRQTAPVGSFGANVFGLHDTSGNAWEWVEDCWHDSYEGAPVDGSAWGEAGGGDCVRRVLRGGSWGGSAQFVRSAGRAGVDTDARLFSVGFRLAQDR